VTDLLTTHLGLSPAAFALVAAMVFGAALIRGLTGFGMAIILVPLLGLIIPPVVAVTLAIFLQLLIGPVGLPTILADADRKSALSLAAIAMLTTPLGILLLAALPVDSARIALAAIAIGAFLLVLLPPHPDGRRPGGLATLLTGVASGVLTGFAAMPGPPVVPYYLRQQIEPKVARASMMLVFFGTAIAGSVASVMMDVANWQEVWLALALFVPMALGNWAGGKAFGKIPPTLWRGAVAVILAVAGVSAVLRAF
jgi:uncharacterized membrane protein YfcA